MDSRPVVAGRNGAQAHLRLRGLVCATTPSGTGDPNLAVAAYASLVGALAPRGQGLRIAVDDAGAELACVRHILSLHPDIIKLDRSLIAGVDQDPGKRASARSWSNSLDRGTARRRSGKRG